MWHNTRYAIIWPMNKKSSCTLPFVKNCSLTRAFVSNSHFHINKLISTLECLTILRCFNFLNRINFIAGRFCFHVNRSHTFLSRLIFLIEFWLSIYDSTVQIQQLKRNIIASVFFWKCSCRNIIINRKNILLRLK